ncbi:MAG TPA: flagellar biosynthetic protein FliR [Burkholderiaceae bacterium]|jgi:flagellar biosynthetic protein FliR
MGATSLASALLDPSRLAAFLLISTRLSGVLLMSAPLGSSLPLFIRLVLCLALSACIGLSLQQDTLLAANDMGALAAAAISEFCLGALLALGVNTAFAAFAVGGRLLDVQIGYGIGQVLDPITQQQVPVLTGAMNQLAMVCFFSSGVFASFLRGLQLSFERIPPGSLALHGEVLGVAMKQGAGMFSLGFALVAPVVFCLMLIEFALGVVARNVPQMNMFALGLPLKILVGLAALALWLGGAGHMVTRTYESIFLAWSGILQ